MDYNKTVKYFEFLDFKAQKIMIGVGIGLFLVGGLLAKSIGAALIGVLIIAGGILLIKRKKDAVPTDEEFDAMVQTQLNGLKEKALKKLGIDEDEVKEIDPIVLDGYNYEFSSSFKRGKDDKYRTDLYEVVYLFFSPSEVHVYKYGFSTVVDKKVESTDVYFYQDVVSASTVSMDYTIKDPIDGCPMDDIQYDAFKLTTAGGTALTVSMRNSSANERSVNAMRQLLREKKKQQ